jgi:hypothetical protein
VARPASSRPASAPAYRRIIAGMVAILSALSVGRASRCFAGAAAAAARLWARRRRV